MMMMLMGSLVSLPYTLPPNRAQEKGYLPEAIVNFVALLGWNSGTTQEIYTMQELIEQVLRGMGTAY